MAFVNRIPDRFVETFYNSSLHLTIDDETKQVVGMYHPPNLEGESAALLDHHIRMAEQGLSPRSQGPTLGMSLLNGTIEEGWTNGIWIIKGMWKHVEGYLKSGPFEMTVDDRGDFVTAKGWWQENGKKRKHPWSWTPATKSKHSLLTQLVHSVWMTRWSVSTAWLFAFMTTFQAWMSWTGCSEHVWTAVQATLNIVYFVFYVSFLGAYVAMHLRPSRSYVLGVIVYTIGYFAFSMLYFLSLVPETPKGVLAGFYIFGSGNFLAGSLLLVYATKPNNALSCNRASSLYFGSIAFLVGSCAFLGDSLGLMPTVVQKDEELSWFRMRGNPAVVFGVVVFLAGRWFFLHGSTTDECGFLYGKVDAKKDEKMLKKGFPDPADFPQASVDQGKVAPLKRGQSAPVLRHTDYDAETEDEQWPKVSKAQNPGTPGEWIEEDDAPRIRLQDIPPPAGGAYEQEL